MARVKNITDDVLEVPSLGLFGVQPGEIVEVPRASDFEGVEGWQITATGRTPKKQTRTKVQAPAAEPPVEQPTDPPTEGDTTTDEEPSL